jgi:DNA-binding CsgD family transcriptional regulator
MWMVAQGMTDKEIAFILGIAVSTVKNTMRMIYEKLEARNRAHAVYRFSTVASNEGVA